MTIPERLDAFKEAFPRQIARWPWLVPEQGREVLYGVWLIGQDYRNKSGFYGAYPPSYLDRVLAFFPDLVNRTDQAGRILHAFKKFLPQGRGTPVKLGAEAYIRQGAALGNYLWLDSQDLGGIEKTILRSVVVWVLGVQREANEIKRTLENLPASAPRLTAADIASLELGQFYACWGRHAIKTYVQPVWSADDEAQRVARGERPPRQIAIRYKKEWDIAPHVGAVVRLIPPRRYADVEPVKEEDDVTAEAAARLQADNDRLVNENKELLRRIEALERAPERRAVPREAPVVDVPTPKYVPPTIAEDLYQTIKARLLAEAPGLIRLLVTKPELEVTVTRKTLPLDEFSLKGRIAKLLIGEFFIEPRGPSAIRGALKKTGPDCNTANIARACDDFVKDGFLTDEGSGYKAVASAIARVVEA